MAFNRALLSGSPAWSTGTPFDGYVLISVVLPNLGVTQVTRVGMDGNYPNQRLPQRIRIPIKNGAFNDKTYIPFNSSLEPPNTQYEARWYDQFDNLIATNAAFFTVEATPFAISIPTLTAPTAGGTATPPDTNPTTTSTASYGEVTMGGDISGQSSAAQVDKIQGKAVTTAGVADGQVLAWSAANSRFQPANSGVGGGDPTMGGDISGTASTASVNKIKGKTVDDVAIGDGKFLKYTAAGTKLEYSNLSGDVSGGAATTSVDKVKGIPFDITGIANGKIPKYNSVTGKFEMADDAQGGGVGGVTMSGDVSGLNSACTVDKVKGIPVDMTGVADGKILKYNAAGAKFIIADDNVSAAPTLAGDVSGAIGANTVDKIKGTAVAATAPTNGQVLKFNGTVWAPAADNDTTAMGGDVTGSQGACSVVKLQGINVSATVPSTGQVLKYDGTAWAPGTDNTSGGSGTSQFAFANAADSSVINNPLVLTQLNKTYTIGSGVLVLGSVVRVSVAIAYATLSSGNGQVQLRIGSTTIYSSGSQALDATAGSAKYIHFQGTFHIRAAGTSGTGNRGMATPFFFPAVAANNLNAVLPPEGGTFTVNTSTTNVISVYVSSDITSSWQLTSMVVEIGTASST